MLQGDDRSIPQTHECALTMTRFAKQKHFCCTAFAALVALLLVAVVAGFAFAQSNNQLAQSNNPAPAVSAPAPPAPSPPASATAAPPPAAGTPPPVSPQPEPAYRPGFLHQLKTWWDDSIALFDRKSKDTRGADGDPNKKPEETGKSAADAAKGTASSAVSTTQDAMKNAVEATKGAASTATDAMKGAVEATKNAATAIVRLPNTRVIEVREVCARAPNGGSDCATAAANGCRAKGFAGGSPLDVRSAQKCDPKPSQAGQTPSVQCAPESVVTRAVCQ